MPREYFLVKLRLLTYHRASLLFRILASGTFLLVNIVFWNVLFLHADTTAGLSRGDIYLYLV